MKTFLLVFFLFFATTSFSQNDSSSIILKVRLIKVEPSPPPCGTVAWALTQKFEVIESNVNTIQPKQFVLLNQPCPADITRNYFAAGHLYKVKIAKTSGAPSGYTLLNEYSKESLPVFWIRDIERVTKTGN